MYILLKLKYSIGDVLYCRYNPSEGSISYKLGQNERAKQQIKDDWILVFSGIPSNELLYPSVVGWAGLGEQITFSTD